MTRSAPILAIFALTTLIWCERCLSVELKFNVVNRSEIQERLSSYKGDDRHREAVLKTLFQASGCAPDKLSEQPVKHLKEPNLICVMPGTTDSVIVVGAHFDHNIASEGVVDNWSGASLLPSLFGALKSEQRQHTFVFIAFAGEEQGLVGSEYYVKTLPPEQRSKIRAMVNMDTLGLGPTEVWISHSDPQLVRAIDVLSQAMKLPLTGVNVDKVGKSDEESFNDRKIPTITIHSLTQSTLRILHSSADTMSVIKFDDYYNTYRLVTGYLVFLDEVLK